MSVGPGRHDYMLLYGSAACGWFEKCGVMMTGADIIT